GDVHHPGDLEPAVAQVAHEDVGEQERAEIADVRRSVDRRPAAVDADVPRLEGLERTYLARQRVAEAGAHAAGPAVPPPDRAIVAIASASMTRPPPASPDRFPVDAFTLIAASSSSSSFAIASRIAGRCDASRGRA